MLAKLYFVVKSSKGAPKSPTVDAAVVLNPLVIASTPKK